MPNLIPEVDSTLTAEIDRLVAFDRARAQQVISEIPAFVQQVSAATVDQAAAQGLKHYTVSALMMRLNWTDSREKPGFFDNISDSWPEDRLPDPNQFLEAPWAVFEYCRKAGYEPFVQRGLYLDCGLVKEPDHDAPPVFKRINSDFRDYFFYIGIRWTVNVT
ncbi:hypothetical protein BH11CYA1_BH11CYA1_07860 [soil metagenome]